MKDLKEVEKLMIDIGLSMREARVYTALFRKKDFTAAEIQQLTNIPRTKIYEVLQQLINRGMCNEIKIGRYKKYEVVNPKPFFENILEDLKSRKNEANRALNHLSPIFAQRMENNNPLEYIEVLKDKNQIHKRFMSFQSEATKEIIAFTKAPYTAPFPEEINDEEVNVLKKGVKIKSIYEYKDVVKEDLEKILHLWAKVGEDIRIVEELPMKMIIHDEKITMFALNDPVSLKPSITTMIISHPSFAKAMKYVFESIWEKAMTLEEFKKNEKLLIKEE